MNLTQTGRFITQLRTAMGLTQAQLAQRLDVTDKAVSKWERGKSLPDITLLNRLAAELRVSVVEILSGKPLKVERSSNLDDVSSWEKGIDQAESLTLKTRDLVFTGPRRICSAAIWSILVPVLLQVCLLKCFVTGSLQENPQHVKDVLWSGIPSVKRGSSRLMSPIHGMGMVIT